MIQTWKNDLNQLKALGSSLRWNDSTEVNILLTFLWMPDQVGHEDDLGGDSILENLVLMPGWTSSEE